MSHSGVKRKWDSHDLAGLLRQSSLKHNLCHLVLPNVTIAPFDRTIRQSANTGLTIQLQDQPTIVIYCYLTTTVILFIPAHGKGNGIPRQLAILYSAHLLVVLHPRINAIIVIQSWDAGVFCWWCRFWC